MKAISNAVEDTFSPVDEATNDLHAIHDGC